VHTPFGTALKDWRTQRRLSQLDLGLSANVSSRHISFLETGRSRPSREMVLRLCEELAVPRPARNQLLSAAGLAPAWYCNRRWNRSAHLQPRVLRVLETGQRGEPLPLVEQREIVP